MTAPITVADVMPRLPSGSHSLWVWFGGDRWLYQVVGVDLDRFAVCVIYSVESEKWMDTTVTVPIRWLRGSARELAEALQEEKRFAIAMAGYGLAA